jgi:hypothetical protein
MPEQSFDPRKFINCEVEQKQFEELLSFSTSARILAVKDEAGGKGKSQLLEKFRHRCWTGKQRIQVSLVALDQLTDHSPLALLKLIVSHLTDLSFGNFKKITAAVDFGNVSLISGVASFDSASYKDIKDLKQGLVVADRVDHMTVSTGALPTLTQAQMNTAREAIFNEFFKDLKSYCAKKPVIIMLDAYDKSESEIKNWILDYLLERHMFHRESAACRWGLVIAGRDVPAFEQRWPEEDCKALVRSIDALSKWTMENVEQCMRARGFKQPSPSDVDFFYQMIERDIPPQLVVQAIDYTLEQARRKVA